MTAIKTPAPKSDQVLSRVFISRIESKVPQCRPGSPVQFVALLSQGVSGTVLRPVTRHIPKGVVVSTVGTDPSNFSKLIQRKRLSGRQTEDLNDLTKLWAELREFFDWDEAMVKAWIEEPLASLDGTSPSAIMSSPEGRDIIREQLDVMRYGDFA
jgi:hypothetical protein